MAWGPPGSSGFFLDKNVFEAEIPGYDPADWGYQHCTVDDNPAIDEGYKQVLNTLPTEALRRALRDGEWVVDGVFFSEWRPVLDKKPWHVIETLPTYRGRPIIEAPHIEIVRALDWGYSAAGNPGFCLWIAMLPDDSAIVFQEYVFKETLPKDAAEEILRRSLGMRVRYTVGDTAMWQEHEGPSIAEHLAAAGLGMFEADKSREAGWISVHNWLREVRDTGVEKYPRMRFLKDGCPALIRAMPDMVVNPINPADMLTTGVEDDGPDCVRYFSMSRPGASRPPAPDVDPHILEMRKKARARASKTDRWAPRVL